MESRVASAARNIQAIRVSYDSVRGARGQLTGIHAVEKKLHESLVPPSFLSNATTEALWR
ncbi:MAG: hypothetical protein DMG34_17435 [Acidobacteria bacterium]|nr:MAG: hypothetical protein DMG34_17435 [Acidobacteriota bacterium]